MRRHWRSCTGQMFFEIRSPSQRAGSHWPPHCRSLTCILACLLIGHAKAGISFALAESNGPCLLLSVNRRRVMVFIAA